MRQLRQLAGLCAPLALLATPLPTPVTTVSQSGLVTGVPGGSIVYIKGGNVWLGDPSGTVRRQLTSDGSYRSPSMAGDGTVGVLRDVGGALEFARISPTGAPLGSFTWPSHYPVRQAALSPDGRTFAHVYSGVCARRRGGTRRCWRLAFTPAHRYQEEVTGTFDSMDYVAIVWLSNQRVMVTGGANYFAVEVYVRGSGVDPTSPGHFVNDDYKIYRTALTPDGQRMVTSQRRFLGFDNGEEVLGPHEVGIYRHVGPAQYRLEGTAERSGIPSAPTVSPDGKAWAFSDDRGIWVSAFGTSELRLIDPDGRDPSWGPYVVR